MRDLLKEFPKTALMLGAIIVAAATSCGPASAPREPAGLRGSVTINKDRGLDPEVVAEFRDALVIAGLNGRGEVPMEKILALFDLSKEQLAVVQDGWRQPGRVICKEWVCQMSISGKSMTVPASKSLWFPLVGYPKVGLADDVVLKFRHLADDKTVEFCSITGVTVSGFNLVGATMLVDGDRSSFSPVFPPSWTYPSKACDF